MDKVRAEQFNEWLNEQLRNKGWTDFQLSTKAGLSHAVIWKARKGILPKYRGCAAIAKALMIPVDEVLRAAGLLEVVEGDHEELAFYFSKLKDSQKQELLNYLKYAAMKNMEEKSHDESKTP